jgi:outer membrane protein assembly factor BamB
MKRPMSMITVIVFHLVAVVVNAAYPSDSIISRHGERGGFAVYLGTREDVVTAFESRDNYSLHVLSPDRGFVVAVRKRLNEANVYGRCSAEHWHGGELPYVENLVSLLICDEDVRVPRQEMLRVLSPNGLALLRTGNAWETLRKPLGAHTDDWPQYLYDAGNNPVSRDTVAGPPRHLQWRGSPRWGRFHEKMSSFAAMVSKGGRIFYIMDEGSPASIFFPSNWQLTARDAYNGTVLWKRPIDKWVTRLFPYKAGPSTVPRRLVASDDALYVTLGIDAPLSKLDPKTGKTLKTYAGTAKADEIILAGDLLLVVVRDQHTVPSTQDALTFPGNGLSRNFWIQDQPARLKAIDPVSGVVRWEVQMPTAPLCTGADEERVYLCDYKNVLALDRKSGGELWTSSDVTVANTYPSGYAPRLVVSDGVVLFAGSENVGKMERGSWKTPSDRLVALCADTGKLLWETDHPASGFQTPEDIFVIKGVVWFGATKDGRQKGPFYGVDLHSGQSISTFEPDNTSYWFHQRCYPQKATDRFILTSRTGTEYVDPAAKHWELNHWVRGGCNYGVMPANGLTYFPAHPCACYPESKLSGMNALAATQRHSLDAPETIERLHRGPAYEASVRAPAAASDDWPLFRCNPERSSYVPGKLSGTPSLLWQARAGSDMTSPIAAAGRIYAADKASHSVFAVGMKDGVRLWSFTAAGRIDSAPTYAQGRVVFGCRDGYVYCLNAHDGVLRWRFLAAPQDKRVFNFEQLESVWPVFGSVLVLDKTVYLTAGRSLFLDGGITFYRLDLETGQPISSRQWGPKAPDGTDYHQLVSTLQPDTKLTIKGYGLTMPPANNDLLSTKGAHLFMTSQVLALDGKRIMTKAGARNEGNEQSHIFAPNGLLDDTWWHRSYQAYGNAVEGGYPWASSLNRVVNGKILCADRDRVYGFGRKATYRKWTVPLEFELFSVSNQPKAEAPKNGHAFHDDYLWSKTLAIWVRAMFVTEDALYVCGPRDLYDEQQAVTRGSHLITTDPRLALQQEHAEGKHGSILKVFDKETGREISSLEIDDMPSWDGMITAEGNIVMTTVNGQILCFNVR